MSTMSASWVYELMSIASYRAHERLLYERRRRRQTLLRLAMVVATVVTVVSLLALFGVLHVSSTLVFLEQFAGWAPLPPSFATAT